MCLLKVWECNAQRRSATRFTDRQQHIDITMAFEQILRVDYDYRLYQAATESTAVRVWIAIWRIAVPLRSCVPRRQYTYNRRNALPSIECAHKHAFAARFAGQQLV